jgi:biotin carboxylase
MPIDRAPHICLVCPTMWDEAELPAIVAADHARVRTFGTDASEHPETFDADAFIEAAVATIRAEGLEGVMATDDYPGSIVAAAIAQELGLPGPSPEAVLTCQHKYYSRLAQLASVPEAVPRFALIDPDDLDGSLRGLEFPVFVKPVKSFFSVFAQVVRNRKELEAVVAATRRHLTEFVKPFNQLVARYTDFEHDGGYLLAEGVLRGKQVTVEGCAYRGDFAIVGIVDSIMFPDTISFQRFEYPSSLDERIQWRMSDIAIRFMRSVGFDNGLFNVEMMYDEDKDAVHIIEVNPRMCPQFADLMEKVNGINTYEVALDIAAGRRPTLSSDSARFGAAASLVSRVFEDQLVKRVPTRDELIRFGERFPEARLKILCREGHRLSDELQDGRSYRYALLHLGGESREHVLMRYASALLALDFEFEPVTSSAAARAWRPAAPVSPP